MTVPEPSKSFLDSLSVPQAPVEAAFDAWLATPLGRYLLQWEQTQIDRVVTDVFGYHAMQLGAPVYRGLRANRMPHRWLALDAADGALAPNPRFDASDDNKLVTAVSERVDLRCHFDALPMDARSLDLVVLPHTLDLARDPHQTLREVERVLVPEGHVVITGFNGASLWGLKHALRRFGGRVGRDASPLLPHRGEFIGHRRLRDWLRLSSMDIQGGRFGCYAPAAESERWLERMAWLDKTGDRWWPVFGAAYVIVAVKRVRGMRLVGLAKKDVSKKVVAPAVAARRAPQPSAIEQRE